MKLCKSINNNGFLFKGLDIKDFNGKEWVKSYEMCKFGLH